MGARILARLSRPPTTERQADGDEQREGGRAERSLAEDVEGEAPDERPGEASLQAKRDGPDDPEHQDRVKNGVTDLQVRDDRELCERGHHGERRGDN